jgi:hypothetical protein
MSAKLEEVWLGFTAMGGRVVLNSEDLGGGVAVLGRGAETMALLVGSALKLSGGDVIYLDLSGRAARELSGYVRTVDSSSVMRDALKVEEKDPWFHCQIVASALSTLFCLPAAQESILESALSTIAAEEGFVSPSAIFDAVGTVSGHRATEKQEVEGWLAGVHGVDASGEEGALEKVLEGGAVIHFSSSPPRLGEVEAALVLAKLLSLSRRWERRAGTAVIVSDAHRLFRRNRYAGHSRMLQSCLISSCIGKVLATELEAEVDERVAGECAVRLISSSVWNQEGRERILPGAFVLQRVSFGSSAPFFPRRFEPARGSAAARVEKGEPPAGLILELLETIASSSMATKASVAAWLSARYDRDEVLDALDRLIGEQLVVRMKEERGAGGNLAALKLTQLGELELRRLRENGEAGDSL